MTMRLMKWNTRGVTVMIKRNVHPARRARVITAITSTTGFMAVISSLAWNTYAAEAAAVATPLDPVIAQVAATLTSSDPLAVVVPAVPANTPAINPVPSQSAAAKVGSTKKTKAHISKKTKAAAATPTKTTTAAPAKTSAPAAKPAAPAAPAAVYTCMSPGGKKENPTSSGKCKNARYGYVLTKI